MDVRMPDGTIIQNVPEGITQKELLKRYGAFRARSAFEESRQSRLASGRRFAEGVEPEPVGPLAQTAGTLARIGIQGLAGLPLAAAEGGAGLANLATGGDFSFANDFQNTLDRFLPPPQDLLGKGVEIVGSGAVGGRFTPQLPRTQAQPAKSPQQQTLEAGQELGLVVPPATVRPTAPIRMLESLGGKAATQQAASARNAEVINRAIRQDLGLPKGSAITPEALRGVRQEAGKIFRKVADSGEVKPGPEYLDELGLLERASAEIAKSFPEANVAKSKEIGELVSSLLRDKFSAKAAVEFIKKLRKESSDNLSFLNRADPAKRALGEAQRDAASALEDEVMRHLVRIGKQDVADAFDNARRLIAKSHSVERALNPSTGNIVARDLASQLKKGKPLSGATRTVGEFARAFPKAVEEVRSSPVSALDAALAVGGGVGIDPTFFAWPLARMAARFGVLSPQGQRALLSTGRQIPQEIPRSVAPGIQAGFGLLDPSF